MSKFKSLLNIAISSSPGENKPHNIKHSYLSLFLHLFTKTAIFVYNGCLTSTQRQSCHELLIFSCKGSYLLIKLLIKLLYIYLCRYDLCAFILIHDDYKSVLLKVLSTRWPLIEAGTRHLLDKTEHTVKNTPVFIDTFLRLLIQNTAKKIA